MTVPLYAQSHSAGASAIILGEFVTNSAVYPAEMDGNLLFTDINNHAIRAASFDPVSGAVTSTRYVSDDLGGPLIDFWQGPDGYMYCADIYGFTIQRLVWVDSIFSP